MPSVLVTGAAGFVGRSACRRLVREGWTVRGAIRSREGLESLAAGVEPVIVGDIGGATDWSPVLKDVEAVVHLAARAHVMTDTAVDPLAAYRATNLQGTRRLAEAAAAAGIGRFVFMSSIKVNGEGAPLPYTERDPARPEDAYGVTKWEAEQSLMELALRSSLRPTILRSPLVYGPGVKGNFLRLLEVISKGLPLPFASIRNRRSLVFVGNLADAIAASLRQTPARPRTFLVSDGEDVSTSELLRRLGQALGRTALLFPFPPFLLRAGGRLAKREAVTKRLLSSLAVDSSAIRAELGWKPPYPMSHGLQDTAAWFRSTRGGDR